MKHEATMFVRSCMIWVAFGLLVHGCGTHAVSGDIDAGAQRQAKLMACTH